MYYINRQSVLYNLININLLLQIVHLYFCQFNKCKLVLNFHQKNFLTQMHQKEKFCSEFNFTKKLAKPNQKVQAFVTSKRDIEFF